MSTHEASSSGSFQPDGMPPDERQRQEHPFPEMPAEGQMPPDAAPPLGAAYDFPTSPNPYQVGETDMHARRRRAWTVVGLAVIVPAAIAGIIAWQLFGSDDPTPTVATTAVTTTTTTSASDAVDAQTATPAQVTVTATTASSDQTATSADGAAATTTSDATQQASQSTTVVNSDGETVSLDSLSPAERLVAWPQIETIQVLSGETLWVIAQSYGTTISAIAALNNITDTASLRIGQELQIPVNFAEEIEVGALTSSETVVTSTSDSADDTDAATVSSLEPDAAASLESWANIGTVIVEDGDSLEAIAIANSTTVAAIMALNGLTNSNLIYIGDELQIPVGFQGEAPVTTDAAQEASVSATSPEPDTADTAPAVVDDLESGDAPVDELESDTAPVDELESQTPEAAQTGTDGSTDESADSSGDLSSDGDTTTAPTGDGSDDLQS